MKVINTITDMTSWSGRQRHAGRTIAFVPTMGALHEGHLRLMQEGRRRADVLAVSIYVNPVQFGPAEDLAKYPRDLEGDIAKCADIGVDAIFTPGDEMMYPAGYRTYVEVERLGSLLCGASRPTHFRGVTTVCAKLFAIVQPHVVIMGEKDFQQLAILTRMVRDLNMPLEIVGLPTVREADGLAMSSRNRYLNGEERRAAASLFAALEAAQKAVAAGERDVSALKDIVRETIAKARIPRIDYIAVVDTATLEETTVLPARLLVAAFVGPARLIDNCKLNG